VRSLEPLGSITLQYASVKPHMFAALRKVNDDAANSSGAAGPMRLNLRYGGKETR
jgi:hypothetical protein